VLPEVMCDQKTRGKLGTEGIAEVTGSLWPRDCQSCGRPLGSKPPALCIDEMGEFATASLHHPRCRPGGWNDGPVIVTTGDNHVSWTTVSFLLPAMVARRPDPRPVMLLNPGLEMIFLELRDGTWHPSYHQQFTSLGMVPPGRKLRLSRPVRDASAWLADDLISVTVESPPETIYEATAPAEAVARARELRGVLFMVTHALDPAALYAAPDRAMQNLMEIMRAGQVIRGWVRTMED
jgi:hypothetical protein